MDRDAWMGTSLQDADGAPLGRVVDVVQSETGQTAWAAVELDSGGQWLVPLGTSDEPETPPRVSVTAAQASAAPAVVLDDGRLAPEDERRLERHYAQFAPRTAAPEALADSEPVVVRSEEELVVTTRSVPYERVRLVKRVVTETVTRTIELRREELHLERVPVEAEAQGTEAPDADAPEAADLSTRVSRGVRDRLAAVQQRVTEGRSAPEPFAGEALEVTLFAEEVEVVKRVVPHERVRLRKTTSVREHTMDESLRREEVEVEPAPFAGAG